jgi:circadian clock protein KaiC
VRQQKTQCLFIDGFGGFNEATAEPERIYRFFIALTRQLHALPVTTLFAVELNNLFGPTIEVPIGAASAVADNIFFMRYVELHSRLHRLISIVKVRESGYDPVIRQFTISRNGISVAASFESAEAILTGIARPLDRGKPGSSAQNRPRKRG